MTKLLIIIMLSIVAPRANAQDSTALKNAAPLRTPYEMSGSELIFSSGEVSSYGQKLKSDGRFSAFLHLNYQSHYDYTPSFGIYSGLSLINVGFAHRLPLANGDDLQLTQRSYSLGIPLAVKVGNMGKRTYLAVGASLEYMFHYRRKAFYNGERGSTSSWFPSEVRPFNSAVFAELHLSKGFYIRAKYYLSDFLRNQESLIPVPGTSEVVSFRPEKSSLGYVSIGWVLMVRKKRHATKSEV
ncbi:hypothetical protein IC235_01060 [Hymenobacter sp. BT664]|uniref:Outer membrane protein beta-barrel domain-containing protein n=1 Tax=Hymenobacter montanus TaxID=2771359 RepID=A0A927B991_9BACT|nr:hypothetical protein [Hymenobacter montanus]MBD2766477.1 hypothetical protein [Hymenobacter montanus]